VIKEKGPLTLRERPKSREETPKEGDGSVRESPATALQQHTLRRTNFKVELAAPPGQDPQVVHIVQAIEEYESLIKGLGYTAGLLKFASEPPLFPSHPDISASRARSAGT
jgi:hypothetical protein